MHRWRRPYPLGLLVWVSVAFILFSIIAAAHSVADILGRGPVWMLVVVGPIWLCVVGCAVRSVLLGVYVSDDGVMSRTLIRTRRVEWRSVAGFRSADLGRQSIYLDLVGGESVRTAIICRSHFDRFQRRVVSGRARYWPDQYDAILAILRAELAARRPAPQSTPVGPSSWDRSRAELDTELQILTEKYRRGELTGDEYAAAVERLRM